MKQRRQLATFIDMLPTLNHVVGQNTAIGKVVHISGPVAVNQDETRIALAKRFQIRHQITHDRPVRIVCEGYLGTDDGLPRKIHQEEDRAG